MFYFGEGAAGSHNRSASFDPPDGAVAGGAVLGYGTAAGGPIPQGWVDGTKVYHSDPETGAPLNSTLDTAELEQIAQQLGVPFLHRESGDAITPALPAVDLTAAEQAEADELKASKIVERRELYWLFSLIAAVLLLIEIVLTIREFRRNRMSRRDVTT